MIRWMKFLLSLLCAAIVLASCEKEAPELPPLPDDDDGIVRILAIGNSFSANAVEQNLYELARSAGKVCEIGNLYIGGCTLAQHADLFHRDAASYEYRTIDRTGHYSNRKGVAPSEALHDGTWDYISVQQASALSGLYETYEADLPALLAAVKGACPSAVILFHQTWAYAADSPNAGFANYGRSQQTMYDAIVRATERVTAAFGIDRVIPSGTAMQNLRATEVGDNLTADGSHLNPLGRYTAACVWFETIFGSDVRENPYERADLPADYQRLARAAAHAAVESPFAVTAVGGQSR